MRRLILIAATMLVAASAHAEETRGLIRIASTDAAQQTQPTATTKPTSTADTSKSAAPKVEAPQVEEKVADAKPAKPQVVRKRETDEQKARRIAARYGVYW